MAEKPKPQDLNRLPAYMWTLLGALCVVLGVSTLAVLEYALAIADKIRDGAQVPAGAESGFIAVTAAIFGILITGVFVFMTFRIDRGAVIEARLTAEREAERVLAGARRAAKNAAEKAIQRKLSEAREGSEEFSVTITNRLREEINEKIMPPAAPPLPPLSRMDGQAGK